MLGEVTTHGALQFRKLSDHARNEVCLAQMRGSGTKGFVDPQCLGDFDRQGLEPARLVMQASQSLVEEDAVQLIHPIVQGSAVIRFPEEAGIGKTGVEYSLIACPYAPRCGATDIAYGDEDRQ